VSSTLESFNDALKDLFALPGSRLKQWVADERREIAWENATCPRFTQSEHDDNCDTECRNSMESVPWTHLNHDCCHFCGDMHERLRADAGVVAWLAEKAKRPPVETDRTKYSDEIDPDQPASLTDHPLLRALKR